MRCYGSKPPEFLRVQPNGNIPVASVDGTVYRQSNDIMHALESLFPDSVPMMYSDSERGRGDELLRLERELFSAWMYFLTGSRDPERYRSNFIAVLEKVERALASSAKGYFMGDRPTIVDVMFLPFLERMVSSMIYFKGLQVRDPAAFPSICRWFEVMETLPAVRLTKSDHYTHCWDLPPQLGGCGMEEEGEPYAEAIDGERDLKDPSKSSWTLPSTSNKDLGGAELDWKWISPTSARRECAERFLHNHGAVATFATRGGGKGGRINKGFPPASAPLADPNAAPEEVRIDGCEDFRAASVDGALSRPLTQPFLLRGFLPLPAEPRAPRRCPDRRPLLQVPR